LGSEFKIAGAVQQKARCAVEGTLRDYHLVLFLSGSAAHGISSFPGYREGVVITYAIAIFNSDRMMNSSSVDFDVFQILLT